jgi:hypothetical protein
MFRLISNCKGPCAVQLYPAAAFGSVQEVCTRTRGARDRGRERERERDRQRERERERVCARARESERERERESKCSHHRGLTPLGAESFTLETREAATRSRLPARGHCDSHRVTRPNSGLGEVRPSPGGHQDLQVASLESGTDLTHTERAFMSALCAMGVNTTASKAKARVV